MQAFHGTAGVVVVAGAILLSSAVASGHGSRAEVSTRSVAAGRGLDPGHGPEEIRISPASVRPGGVFDVALDCRDATNAFVTSKAFGRVGFNGRDSVEITAPAAPGRYLLRGGCGGGEPRRGAWLTVGDGAGDRSGDPDDRFGESWLGRLFEGLGGRDGFDGGHDRGGRGWSAEEQYDGGGFAEDGWFAHRDGGWDEDGPWPSGGVATGDGVTAMRAVSPAASAGIGVAVVGVIAGAVAFLRLRRRNARRA
ncbi:hypothetical protein Misp01_78500 [Microtetraspora sp. NBRC 13810]|uniref:hypothetical protein n=1 Tax=Microtetraspora sp. NBRC 13810 TaxID=3030990 RepID=UPI0024A05BE5|nr:hypothetical protein [Microtetraspora sp. NBRC 13810]GLW12722.1 hypothetical protein Misp01_78500 [Microtetraspora sp. NBRC 13810]